MPFAPTEFLDETTTSTRQETIQGDRWVAVNEHACEFTKRDFLDVALNLIKNPNINSSHLFRADIFYDSCDAELEDAKPTSRTIEELQNWSENKSIHISGFRTTRRIIRQLVPRNPQLDCPVAQTCFILEWEDQLRPSQVILIMLPHVSRLEDLPWYHPAVRAVAYWYQSPAVNESCPEIDVEEGLVEPSGKISVHYQLFETQQLPLNNRLLRTARSLLQVLYKHGQGRIAGYQKKGQHDQIISQKRVQDKYTELKAKHAKRLCEAWVEQTEPSKHVFEDLGIAAYLIELWKDMYALPGMKSSKETPRLPPFPGFVDIGCGNGVLTEILLLSGYPGHGFDGRRRKTWSVLSPRAQAHLHETLCVPQPLFDLHPASPMQSKSSLLSRARALLHPSERTFASSLQPPRKPWHNGLFPNGTFIISNHADELTPWTPLLACLTASPFLAIPCCSHNLSGARFRAPSAYNSHIADAAAPSYFDGQKQLHGTKSIPIMIPTHLEDAPSPESRTPEEVMSFSEDTRSADGITQSKRSTRPVEVEKGKPQAAESGDLTFLAPAQRAKQPSAYASLCEWVSHIASEAGYIVERDHLRIPSTRNIGLLGRAWTAAAAEEMQGMGLQPGGRESGVRIDSKNGAITMGKVGIRPVESNGTILITNTPETPMAAAARKQRVYRIVLAEGADAVAWVRRCDEVLAKGGGVVHGPELNSN